MGNTTMEALAKVGTSVWLDDLSHRRLTSDDLKNLIEELRVVGVTTNPAILSSAMTTGEDYDSQLAQLTTEGANPADAVFAMAIDDVRDACDLFVSVAEETDGVDGRVSIEVDPRYADNYKATIAQAHKLWERVGKQNAIIKIPATDASLLAVTQAPSESISVNVTLIFPVECYLQVIDASIEGIEHAKDNGVDLESVHSVISLFVSRVDTEIDARLDKTGSKEALALRGRAGLANARAAYAKFEETFSSQNIRWAQLENTGVRPQRLLWASTGVKNPAYPDILYVIELTAPQAVNTMPEKTLHTAMDYENGVRDTINGQGNAANAVMTELSEVGIGLDDVFAVLEREGVEKFVDSWQSLLESIAQRVGQLKQVS